MKLPTAPKKRETDLSKYKFLVYGVPKSGKSTLASKFPKAIFIPTEPGLNFLECHQITDDDGNPTTIRNWTEFCNAVKLIVQTKHEFKTVVIDTVDNALEFCALHFLKSQGLEHESDGDYGKGWGMITREFTKAINYMANSGFGVVFISHEKTEERETKGIKRQYTDCSLSKGGRKYICGLVDFIFYIYQDNDHNRLMKTKATLNLNAGDRTGHLPAEMTLDWPVLKRALDDALTKEPTTKQPSTKPVNHAPGAK